MICGDLNGKEIQKEGDISCTYGASQVALVVKNLPVNAGDIRDVGLIPGSGRSPWKRAWLPTPVSCLENPMDRGAWWLQSMSNAPYFSLWRASFIFFLL